MKDHEIAHLVNDLVHVANTYTGMQQLRERISRLVVPELTAERVALEREREVSDKLEKALEYVEAYLESALDDEEETGRLMGARMLLGDAQKFLAEVAALRATHTSGESA